LVRFAPVVLVLALFEFFPGKLLLRPDDACFARETNRPVALPILDFTIEEKVGA
jgi:hypothetical protein